MGGYPGWEVMDLTCWRGVVRAVDSLLRGARCGLINALVGGSLWLIGRSGESFSSGRANIQGDGMAERGPRLSLSSGAKGVSRLTF